MRAGAALSIGAAMLLALTACQVRPLYAPVPTGGSVAALLPAIEVDPPETRPEQVFRNALIFGLTGGGNAASPLYKLDYRIVLSEQPLGVEQVTGTPLTYQLSARISYIVRDSGSGAVLTEDRANAVASYNRSSQNFANVRAARDAEDRVASELARQVQLRLAQVFSARAAAPQ